MSESLFWQDGFLKERRIDLVAALLYAKDLNARIPNDEGLRPDRIDDFYATVRFQSAADFDMRMATVRAKYRYGDIPVEADIDSSKPRIEPVVETLATEPPVVEAAAPDVPESAPVLHAEDRVSALARRALAWFRREQPTVDVIEHDTNDAVDPSRMREVVSGLFSKELGASAFEDVAHDPKMLAHLEAANRLERAIATSRGLDAKTRAAMKKQLEDLRAIYQDQMATLAGKRRTELQNSLDESIAARARGSEHSALRLLARRDEPMTRQLVAFRERVEHAALQRGGVETVAQIDAAFQNAWQEAWQGSMIPSTTGPLEGSLTRLRLLQDTGSGVAVLVAQARISVQEHVDRELPKTERAMKRAA